MADMKTFGIARATLEEKGPQGQRQGAVRTRASKENQAYAASAAPARSYTARRSSSGSRTLAAPAWRSTSVRSQRVSAAREALAAYDRV